MGPFENFYHQKLYYPPDMSSESVSLVADGGIEISPCAEDNTGANRTGNELSSAIELMKEAALNQHKLSDEILRLQLDRYDQLYERVSRSLQQMEYTLEQSIANVQNGLPIRDSIRESALRTFDANNSHAGGHMDQGTIRAQVVEYVNWHDLQHTDLLKVIMESYFEETQRKLKTLIDVEATRMDRRINVFLNSVRGFESQRTCDSNSSAPPLLHDSEPVAATSGCVGYGYGKAQENGRCLAAAADPASPANCDEWAATPANVRQIAEPKVVYDTFASVGRVSPHKSAVATGKTSCAQSPRHKIQQIFGVLRRKQEAQSSMSVAASPEEVRSRRATAQQVVEQLWESVETHSVKAVPCHTLCTRMKMFVVLSLMKEEKTLFYEQALYCAQQLRNPADVDELAVVTHGDDNNAADASFVDWCDYESSSTSQCLLLLSPEEKQFFKEVKELEPKTLVIWCSAYACVLLRLGDRGASYVRHQLQDLNHHLAEAYRLQENSLPQVPLDSPSFEQRLRQYANYTLDPLRRDTLYKGLVERYECSPLSKGAKKFLNFLLLRSLRYRGMSLITLVDEFVKLYLIPLETLVEDTWDETTAESWQTYHRFKTIFKDGSSSRCKKYKYCEVFRPHIYSNLHFNANYRLCYLLCVLIDVKMLKSKKRPLSTALYHRIVKKTRANSGSQSPPMDAEWNRKCLQILKKFAKYWNKSSC